MAHTLISQILGLGAQLIPSGGTTGQVLSKSSNTDYAVIWSTVTGGSGGGEPIFLGSPAYSISTTDISNWNSAYGWGNHALAGYLTSETDPVYTASPSYGITSTLISQLEYSIWMG